MDILRITDSRPCTKVSVIRRVHCIPFVCMLGCLLSCCQVNLFLCLRQLLPTVQVVHVLRLVPIFIGCLFSRGCLYTRSPCTQLKWVLIFIGCLFCMGVYYPESTVTGKDCVFDIHSQSILWALVIGIVLIQHTANNAHHNSFHQIHLDTAIFHHIR